ncbi:TadA family conjugal transfer-associated ATPase [Arthrobacter castelli]|uniref:TadA family conjugal transfer-associated ATPase n=1 Tax=Arthrobacter castelli TaxID=271431 RepID=UPI0004077F41|nr:TadA family conjugal transfer-associated ATPase [Arthrobacter castelli]
MNRPRDRAARHRGSASFAGGEPAGDDRLVSAVRESVMSEAGPVTASRVAEAVQSTGRLLGTAGTLDAVERIRAELAGLGPLQPLVKDPAVTDIFVNGADSVWVDRGAGAEPAETAFANESQVRALATRLVAAGGRRLDDGSPCADVRLDGGYRIHAVLPPISTAGVLLSVRIGRTEVFSLQELTAAGTLSPGMAALLESIIAGRLNFLISGATGSGKTTLLSSMLSLCGTTDRLVLIEDAAELNPVHSHVVGMQSRHGNLEGTGIVDLAELVRQALRMRPDRLIVGECRGAEVRELLTAMNTGHSGGGGTIHANTASSVPARLAALGALAGMSRETVGLQTLSAVDAIIHVERSSAGRRIGEVAVLDDDGNGGVVVRKAAVAGDGNELVRAGAWEDLQARIGRVA